MLSPNLTVVLHKLRFPENAGMVARACANMGISQLRLSAPRNWDCLKAWPTATSCGQPLLRKIELYDNLTGALSDCNSIYGTSARQGGWRQKNALNPAEASLEIGARLEEGEKIALLFGPEDSGLSNEELNFCTGIVHIETDSRAASLNISQAVLLVLYELRSRLVIRRPRATSSRITFAEQILLEQKIKEILSFLQCLSGKNSDYAFRQWHEMLSRIKLRKNEYAALMGLCRQFENIIPRQIKKGNENGDRESLPKSNEPE